MCLVRGWLVVRWHITNLELEGERCGVDILIDLFVLGGGDDSEESDIWCRGRVLKAITMCFVVETLVDTGMPDT